MTKKDENFGTTMNRKNILITVPRDTKCSLEGVHPTAGGILPAYETEEGVIFEPLECERKEFYIEGVTTIGEVLKKHRAKSYRIFLKHKLQGVKYVRSGNDRSDSDISNRNGN